MSEPDRVTEDGVAPAEPLVLRWPTIAELVTGRVGEPCD